MKAGDTYQDIVTAVVKAIHPSAEVTKADWVDGPDGRRDMDVAIRSPSPQLSLVLLECKDWQRPVGIGAIDALESKRRDLGASQALIYSNSGFTKPALRKATRVGIGALSALKANDSRVKLVLEQDWVAKRLSVERWRWIFYPESVTKNLDAPVAEEVIYKGAPVVNWIHGVSAELLRQHETAEQIKYLVAFREPEEFVVSGTPVRLRGLGFLLYCRRTWLSQIVRVDVSLGSFNHQKNQVIIPNEQAYILGSFDRDAWRPTGQEWTEEMEPEPGTFELRMTLMNPVRRIVGDVPDVEAAVLEREIKTSPPFPRVA